jgi:hypothetical protein
LVDTADFALWRNNLGAVAQVAVAGDFDGSGAATQADYQIWRASFGSTTDLRADANRDGLVDALDYVIWRRAQNSTAAGQALNELLGIAAAIGDSESTSNARVAADNSLSNADGDTESNVTALDEAFATIMPAFGSR